MPSLQTPILTLAFSVVSAMGFGLLAGCTSSGPLDSDQPRTPSAHYRELRGEDPPLTVEDSLGNSKPNLRGRLLPK